MNILCDIDNPLDEVEMTGWGKVFVSLNHSFLFLKRKEKAILDAFEEKKPDIFITHIDLINRATKKAIEKNNNCKSVIFINTDDDKEKLKNIDNIIWVSNNKNSALLIEPSCDLYLCLKPKTELSMISDICYVGDFIKNNIIDKLFNNFKTKFWNKKVWPYETYLGNLKFEKTKNAICSSTLSFYFDELKNKKWPLYVYMCKKPVINFGSKWLKSMLINNDLNFEDEDLAIDCIKKIIKNSELATLNIEHNYDYVKNNHLSHHRVSAILDYAGFKEEARKCLTAVMEITEKY